MDTDYLISAFTTLFVIIDPPGLAPIFIAVTAGLNAAERRLVAIRSCIVATLVLIGFAVLGTSILAFLGISLAAFRVAGGLLMFWIAFEMVFERREDRKAESVGRVLHVDELHGLAVFPVAIPLISGPGAISATVVIASQAPTTVHYLAVIAMILVIMAMTLGIFLAADPIDRRLGATGRAVITRLFGLVLAALSVQIVADGTKTLMAAPVV
jgi:multiple antibiotic resistance protein